MKRTKTELIDIIKKYVGDRDDDETLSLLEDISDSYSDESEDWKAKYEENDKSWRTRYIERFGQSTTGADLPGGGETHQETEFDTAITDENLRYLESTYDSTDIDDIFKED